MSQTMESPASTSSSIESLRERILALPAEEREQLLASVSGVPGGSSFALHPAWKDELNRRLDDLRSGRVKGIPAEDVFREIDGIVDQD